MRTNLRPIALAIDWPSDVLPTPGGPTRQRIGPFMSFFSLRTARYSRMRFFTFSSEVVSFSSPPLALSTSRLSSVFFDQGRSAIHSRYVRATVYSDEAVGMLLSRL